MKTAKSTKPALTQADLELLAKAAAISATLEYYPPAELRQLKRVIRKVLREPLK